MNLFYKEILTTNSLNELPAVAAFLKSHNIPTKRKSVNRNFHGLSTRRSILGTVGENLSLETQYYLYVHKSKQEEAEYLIHNWRRNK